MTSTTFSEPSIELILVGLMVVAAMEWIARERRLAGDARSTKFDLVRAFVWALAVMIIALTLYFAPPALVPNVREHRFVDISLELTTISLVAGAAWRLRAAFACRRREAEWDLWLDPCLILLWSLVVRFGLTAANILTDGGSGYVRLLQGPSRFSGLSVLVRTVMPSAWGGLMWPSMIVPRTVAAFTPALLTIVARQLGVGRRVGALAGLCLASYPLHAAMFSSDFLAGTSPAFALLGFALMLAGRSKGGEGLFGSGVLVLAYSLWIRPDAVLAVAPGVLMLFVLPIRFWLKPVVVASVAWLLGTAIAYALTFNELQTTLSGREIRLWGPWVMVPLKELAASSAVLPLWLWVPALPGLLFLPGIARWFALAGAILGIASAHLGAPVDPTTETWMELFRYSAPAMPWIALLAAAGMVGVVDLVDRVSGLILGERRLRLWLRRGLLAGVVILVMSAPLWHRTYLSRHYQNRTDEKAFLAALRLVPAGCGLVVPDDETEDPSQPSGGIEAFVRYRLIAEESVRRREVHLNPLRVVGLRAFRRAMGQGRRLPKLGEVKMRFFEVANDSAAPACWYFYEGTYCAPGLPNFPTTQCAEFLAGQPHEQVATWPIEFWSHRLMTRPDHPVAPLYDPRRVLALHHLSGG